MIEVIVGPMGCGKTEELLRRIRRAKIAKKQIQIFSPIIDTRSKKNHIESRNGLNDMSIPVKDSKELLEKIDFMKADIVALDEIQFFDKNITEAIKNIVYSDIKVICCGLDLNFREEPFGQVPNIMALATKVDKLSAICMRCGSDNASRTQRIINGKPATKRSPEILVGGDDKYEARCLNCYERPEK